MSAWAKSFIGIPFANKGRDFSGCDCWGLVRLVHAKHASIFLPSYDDDYYSSAEHLEISAIVAKEAASPLWMTVDQPQALDILWFRRGRHDAHCGLFLAPGIMLHMVEEDCSKIERFDGPAWSTKLTGIYRWRGAA